MNRRAAQTFLLGLLIVGSFTLLLLIIGDSWPVLRGPAPETSEWYWPHLLRPFARWWPAILSAIAVWLVAGWWLWPARASRLRSTLALFGLVVTTLALQLAIVYADRGNVPAALVDRTLSNLASGFFEPAAEIADIQTTLRSYPAVMPTFASEHARTHPPGLIVANWATIQALGRLEGVATAVATRIWPLRCTDLWLLDRSPAVAAALGMWALLPLLAASLSALPAYLVSHALLAGRAARLSVVLAATLPALLLFAPKSVQLYAPLSLLLFWLFHSGLARHSLCRLFLAGLLLSVLTFLSLGNATLAPLLAAYAALLWWLPGTAAAAADLHAQSWRAIGLQVLAFVVGALSLWLIYWIGWGVPPWAIAREGLGQHYSLVTSLRRYDWWVAWNLLDLLVFSGWPLILGFGGSLFLGFRAWRRGRATCVDLLAAALLLLIAVLDLSGSARGEVGRIWLFFMPLLAFPAARFWEAALPGRVTAVLVSGLQLAILVALGLAWQPVRPVIVVAEQPQPLAAEPDFALDARFATAPLTLAAAALAPLSVAPGESVTLTLFWESDGPAARPYTVFNHLVDEDGRLVSQADGWPVNGTWPPTCWQPGDIVADRHTLLIPKGTPPGFYQLRTGLYDARDGARLALQHGGDTIETGEIQVIGPPVVGDQ